MKTLLLIPVIFALNSCAMSVDANGEPKITTDNETITQVIAGAVRKITNQLPYAK